MNEAFAEDEDVQPDPVLNRISSTVIGCAIAVHRELGPGHLEIVYQKAMAIEMRARKVAFEEQKPVVLTYRGEVVGEGRMDFVVEELVVVDLKASRRRSPSR
jgi:GxxExxY protein